MGVPAFYRWLSEKYPKCVVDVKEDGAPCIDGTYEYSLSNIEASNPNGFEIDNLYIDMNGIIHPCAHPENGDQPKTEEEMYVNVMKYVDRLVAAMRPRRVLYLAIDGVAPRAKMNQQRARRFRSAQEAEQRTEVEAEAREYMEALGHKVPPKEKSWDSNVITPGTKFMSGLAKFLRFYIRDRMNNVPGWKKLKVILSDASVPGEGEHKIMSFIRQQRSQPGYDPNQHHCLHGLDADLIMLGLATHEVKFTISREEVLFGKKKYAKDEAKIALDANGTALQRGNDDDGDDDGDLSAFKKDPKAKPFQFLHVHTLREYLQVEFEEFSVGLPFQFQFERVIDDFVFLCFFVGNDFLPHLPALDIREGAVDFLMFLYKRYLPSLGGYLTDGGYVNLSRVDVILAEVGRVEDEIFRRRRKQEVRQEERRAMHKRTRQQGGRDRIGANAALDSAVAIKRRKTTNDKTNQQAADTLRSQLQDGTNTTSSTTSTSTTKVVAPSAENNKYLQLTAEEAVKARVSEKVEAQIDKHREEIEDVVRLGESGWKERYYADKYKSDDIAHGGGREQVYKAYVTGLCWVMRYYYTGCASWEWFYPFHYAPFASDLLNIDRFEVSFELGEPFRPFEQLMGVFPASSKHAIPKPFRWLMTDAESPIIDFYPTVIPVDPNGKPQPWLWVVLLPFIDQERLLAAMEPHNKELSDSEKKRNERYGQEILFVHHSHELVDDLPTKENLVRTVAIDIRKAQSMSGKATYVETLDFPLQCTVPAPKKAPAGALQDVPNNHVVSVMYEPPPANKHKCALLENANVVPATLSEEDKFLKIPRLGRGASIIDLAGAAAKQYMDDYYRNNRRGPAHNSNNNNNNNSNQPFVNRNYGQTYNQYLQDGHRGWGSLEPRQKQPRRGGFQGHSNNQPQRYAQQQQFNHNNGGRPPAPYHHHHHNSQQRSGRGGFSYGGGSARGGYSRPHRGAYNRGPSNYSHRNQNSAQYEYQQRPSAQPIRSAVFNNQNPNARPTLDSLRAGLRQMHHQQQDTGSNPNRSGNGPPRAPPRGPNNNSFQRFDRRY